MTRYRKLTRGFGGRTAREGIPTPREVECPPRLRQLGARAYRMGQCTILVSLDLTVDSADGIAPRWHLSISHPDRYPTWDELAKARETLLPADRVYAQFFPADWDIYVNLHPNCFHIWETSDREPRHALER